MARSAGFERHFGLGRPGELHQEMTWTGRGKRTRHRAREARQVGGSDVGGIRGGSLLINGSLLEADRLTNVIKVHQRS